MPRKPLKPGEVAVEVVPGADATLGFIGHVETPFATPADCPRQGDPEQGPECTVVIEAPWDLALEGIEGLDWIELYLWFHLSRRDLLVVDPPHGSGLRGVFALRAPMRPNPIAVSRVRLLRREGNRLIVRGLEAVSGTPLLDIKPARRCPAG